MTWEARLDPCDPNAWDVYEGERKVAHLPWCREAEARLISAAPALLRLLKKASGAFAEIHGQDIGCPDCPESGAQDCTVYQEIKAAIAKAESRP